MNIDGLSEATLEKFISLGYLNSFKDIYKLSEHRKDLIKLDGFGVKSVDKLLQAIEKSRNVKLENFIAALGINGIGLSASKTIVEHFNHKWDLILNAIYCKYDFTQLDDFGEVMANNFTTYFSEHFVDLCALSEEMHFIEPEHKSVISTTFNGKALCVTGKLNHFTRDSINEKIASVGAKSVGSVSKKTDYLITNEASGSSKYKKAVELGVPIITEDEFLKMLEG
jgi:DNA ligase (NAD+)